MGKKTPLYECHKEAHANIVDFAGWDMPLHYGSQLKEHLQVRQDAGVFDVSHMAIVDLHGRGVAAYLRNLLANDIDRLVLGKALYTCMLNEQGGIIDDLIVYKITDDYYRLVVNAGTRDKDILWLTQHLTGYDLTLHERTDLAMLAIQGPTVRDKISLLFDSEEVQRILALQSFHGDMIDKCFVSRTGYTGEDGFEIMLPAADAPAFWNELLSVDILPCGLGARDTLRLEAGLGLYGADMDESVTPFESNLSWTVALPPTERQFIGRAALEQQLQAGVTKRLVGLVLEGQGVLRNHQKVIVPDIGVGEITSGSYSPTLNKGIALARVPAETGLHCLVEIRGKQVPAQVIKPPFVRQGKKTFRNVTERENE